jgi:hypothetical protein
MKMIPPKKLKRLQDRAETSYKKVERKKASAKGDPLKLEKINRKYGYNYAAADRNNIQPDSTGHYPSRVPSGPEEGLILKAKKHPTMPITRAYEKELGYRIKRKNGQLYSIPKNNHEKKKKR